MAMRLHCNPLNVGVSYNFCIERKKRQELE